MLCNLSRIIAVIAVIIITKAKVAGIKTLPQMIVIIAVAM